MLDDAPTGLVILALVVGAWLTVASVITHLVMPIAEAQFRMLGL